MTCDSHINLLKIVITNKSWNQVFDVTYYLSLKLIYLFVFVKLKPMYSLLSRRQKEAVGFYLRISKAKFIIGYML